LVFPPWEQEHQDAFDGIKGLVIGSDCLTTIDHDNMGDNHIFVTCDASDWRTGTVLSYSLTWETARPVAFDLMALKSAQLNYPVHEKELPAIIRALQKWCSDLLGAPITIYTDHRTLENFDHQKDLSRHQAQWQEFLSQYDYQIVCTFRVRQIVLQTHFLDYLTLLMMPHQHLWPLCLQCPPTPPYYNLSKTVTRQTLFV
jgi:hypothetical protein